MLTIVIPVKTTRNLDEFIEKNLWWLTWLPVIVIDSGGGEKLQLIANTYIKKDCSFWEARKYAYELVETPYVMNLDSDVIIPNDYPAHAFKLLEDPNVGAVSLFFEGMSHFGVLEYGISIWKTDLVRKLYDFDAKMLPLDGTCECTYMWRKLWHFGYRVQIVDPYFARHLRETKIYPKL